MRLAERFDAAIATLRARALGRPAFGLSAAIAADPELVERVRALELAWHAAPSHERSAKHGTLVAEAEALAAELAPRNALVETPGTILAEMKTTDAIIAQLGQDIDASPAAPSFKHGWRRFADEWREFFTAHQSWWSRGWYAVYEKTIEFRQRAATWRSELAQLGGKATGPVDRPPSTTQSRGGLPHWQDLAVAGGALVGGVLVLRALFGR